jgi:hypothetical protein
MPCYSPTHADCGGFSTWRHVQQQMLMQPLQLPCRAFCPMMLIFSPCKRSYMDTHTHALCDDVLMFVLRCQVSEGGRVAVRATVRLSVALSTLLSKDGGGGGGGGQLRSKQGASCEGGGGGTASPRGKAASADYGICRPIFTVAAMHRIFTC